MPPCLFKWGRQLERDKLLVCWDDQPFDLLGICSDDETKKSKIPSFPNSIKMGGFHFTVASKSHASLVTQNLLSSPSANVSYSTLRSTKLLQQPCSFRKRILSSRTESMSVINNDGQLSIIDDAQSSSI